MSYFLLARSGPNTVDLRIVPVIVIPGIMGSRLRLSNTDAPMWDVDASLEMYGWLDARVTKMRGWLHHKQSSATLLTDGPYTTEQNARGWGTISSTYYRELLLHLEDEIDLGPGIRCPVYAFGYDWRKSNGDSAARLVQFTRATLDAEGAEEAIFVTHSMGGLVARAAIKRDAWLKSRTIGVVHLAQPACGAPVAYRRLYDGAGFLSDGWKVACLMGREPADTFHLFSALPGALELLPYDQGKDDGRGRTVGEWLMYRRTDVDGHTYTGWTGIATSIGAYKSSTYPPSIAPNLHLRDPAPKGLTREEQDMYVNARNEAKSLLKGASKFVTKLGVSSSANTWSLASGGITTDTAVCFELGAEGLAGGATIDLDAGRTDDGDGTVPVWSAFGLAAARGDEPLDEASDPETTFKFLGSGIAHDTFCDDAQVRELVARIIETMMMVPLHGVIETRGPELLTRRIKAIAGDRAAEMEIRVAKWFREARGAHVFFNDNPDTEKSSDLTVDGHLVEVKLLEGAVEHIVKEATKGLQQVARSGSDGIVVLVRGAHAREHISEYHKVADELTAKPGSPTILVLEENELPPLFEMPRPPRPRGDEN